MKVYCLMIKYKDSNRTGYHSVYTNEGTARSQLLIRNAHADYNMEYYLEEKHTQPVNDTVRLPDSAGVLILDTRKTEDVALVRSILTGKPL